MTEERVVIFRIQEEECAVQFADVIEIVECWPTAKFPGTSHYLEGTLSFHGQCIPLVRLSAKFGMAGDRPEDRRVIVLAVGSQEVGIIVDEVIEVCHMKVAEVEPVPGGDGEPGACIRGIGKIGGRLIIVLDIAELFSADDLSAFRFVQEGCGRNTPA